MARAVNPPIVRYNPQDQSIVPFNYDGSAQSLSFDKYSDTVYWANFIPSADEHEILKTSYNGQTEKLNITYSESIQVETDELFLYVLVASSMRIDKYLKSSLKREGNVTFDDEIVDFVIGKGKLAG